MQETVTEDEQRRSDVEAVFYSFCPGGKESGGGRKGTLCKV